MSSSWPAPPPPHRRIEHPRGFWAPGRLDPPGGRHTMADDELVGVVLRAGRLGVGTGGRRARSLCEPIPPMDGPPLAWTDAQHAPTAGTGPAPVPAAPGP